MTKPQFDMRISLGNILSLFVLVAGIVGAFYVQRSEVEMLGLRLAALKDRTDMRFEQIDGQIAREIGYVKDSVQRIEKKIDKLDGRPVRP